MVHDDRCDSLLVIAGESETITSYVPKYTFISVSASGCILKLDRYVVRFYFRTCLIIGFIVGNFGL